MSVCDDPVNGTKSTVKNDPRITRVGKYLRKYDLDELPQFINVLKGRHERRRPLVRTTVFLSRTGPKCQRLYGAPL